MSAHVPADIDLLAVRHEGEIFSSLSMRCSCGEVIRHGSLSCLLALFARHSGEPTDVAPFLERMFGPSLSVSVVDRGEDQCATTE